MYFQLRPPKGLHKKLNAGLLNRRSPVLKLRLFKVEEFSNL
jgi:hypothetical protein